jgi:hypothetical protein
MAVEEEDEATKGPTTVTVESGAFTISSTVGEVPILILFIAGFKN